MSFSHLEYLLLLPFFILLYVWAWKPRQWVIQPSRVQVRKSSFLSRFTLAVPLFCWLGVCSMLILALANPRTRLINSFVTVEKTILVMCIDVSTSMGRGENSTMEKIRTLALDFVKQRKNDVIGVTAYSGAS